MTHKEAFNWLLKQIPSSPHIVYVSNPKMYTEEEIEEIKRELLK